MCKLALHGGVVELIVGDGAPQEERQTRGEFEIAHAIGGVGSGIGGVGFHAEDELGAGDDAAHGHFDALIEVAFVAAALVEAEHFFHVVIVHGAAVGAAG